MPIMPCDLEMTSQQVPCDSTGVKEEEWLTCRLPQEWWSPRETILICLDQRMTTPPVPTEQKREQDNEERVERRIPEKETEHPKGATGRTGDERSERSGLTRKVDLRVKVERTNPATDSTLTIASAAGPWEKHALTNASLQH